MRIGIYGGSFNPIHLGHVKLAHKALNELNLDKLLVIPAAVSPFKVDEQVVMPWDRLELVKAAFAGIDKIEVDERELKRGGVSYAVDTVMEISNEYRGAEIHFIIGEDSLAGLAKWKDYETLKTLCTFDAFPRTPESSSAIRKLFEENKVVLNSDARLAKTVREGVVRKNGYCPCRLAKLPEFFCPCDEFKAQLADPNYHGLCHCRLYLKP